MDELMVIKDNYYKLDRALIEQIKNVQNDYFYNLDNIITTKIESVDTHLLPAYLLAIAEYFEYFSDQSKWLENSYIVLEKIKMDVQANKVLNASTYYGLADICISVKGIYEATGKFKKILNSLDALLNYAVGNSLMYVNAKKNDLKMMHYDAISGIAGVGNYLLLDKDKNKRLIKECLLYLQDICGNHQEGELYIPNWHIKAENQFRDDEKISFPEGNFNFSLSHGIAGPMVFMSKAYRMGIRIPGQLETIKQLINLYLTYMRQEENDVYYWPGQLSYSEFVKRELIFSNHRMSWCYGTIGITRALFIVAKSINDANLEKFAINNMKNIINLPTSNYYLTTPILCHGYAGPLIIADLFHKEKAINEINGDIEELVNNILSYYSPIDHNFLISEYNHIHQKVITRQDFDFLEGTTGVILSLLSILSEKKYFLYQEKLLIV